MILNEYNEDKVFKTFLKHHNQCFLLFNELLNDLKWFEKYFGEIL
jgi:hypothetical protein